MRLPAVLAAVLLPALALANPNGLGFKPAMGWNTWCTEGRCGQTGAAGRAGGLHDVCNEAEVLSIAQAISSNGMLAAGYEYITLDDCWAATSRDANDRLQGDADRFPRGMKALADSLHGMGFKMGLYTSVGIYTCNSGGRPGNVPGSYGHYELDAATFAEWGIDWVKMDYCAWHWNTTVLLPEPQTRIMAQALNKTGRPMWFNFHCVVYDTPNTTWCADYGNSYRTGSDHHDNWQSTLSVIQQTMPKLAPYAGRYAWPDPDYLMTGGAGCDNATAGLRCPGQTDEEYRTEFSLWVLAGGQLVVASDVRNMSALQRSILLNEELLAVFNDPLAEIGHQAGFWPCKGNPLLCTIWVRRLSEPGCAAVGLLNADNSTSHRITAEFTTLGLGWDAKTNATARDLWAHQDEPPAVGSYTADVAVHQTKVVKLCKQG